MRSCVVMRRRAPAGQPRWARPTKRQAAPAGSLTRIIKSHRTLRESLMIYNTVDTRATGEMTPALLSRGTLSGGGCGTRAQNLCSLSRAPGFFNTGGSK